MVFVCAQSCLTLVPLSIGFSRQEYWSRVQFPTSGDLSDPGMESTSISLLHWQEDSLPLVTPGKPMIAARKMVTATLYARQQKRHRCIEQSFGLYGRGRVWDDLREWHWNMYNIIYGMNRQSRFDAQYWMLGAGALGWPRGMVCGGKWEGGSGWGPCAQPWQIHVDVWQNQYNIVK